MERQFEAAVDAVVADFSNTSAAARGNPSRRWLHVVRGWRMSMLRRHWVTWIRCSAPLKTQAGRTRSRGISREPSCSPVCAAGSRSPSSCLGRASMSIQRTGKMRRGFTLQPGATSCRWSDFSLNAALMPPVVMIDMAVRRWSGRNISAPMPSEITFGRFLHSRRSTGQEGHSIGCWRSAMGPGRSLRGNC